MVRMCGGLLALALLIVSFGVDRHAALGAASWTPTGPMNLPHSSAVAALLPNGRVLVAGGETPDGLVEAAAEVFNPLTSLWTRVPDMSTPRTDFTATPLKDGRVLVIGGTDGTRFLASAEMFNPTTNNWTQVTPMFVARSNHTATLLNDGTVLVVGGFGTQGPLNDVERYDPSTNSWKEGDPLRTARGNHTATKRADGQVLITGGYGPAGPLDSVELYDPTFNRFAGFTPLPSMLHARYSHTATLLPDGRILVAGGINTGGTEATTELYDPATGGWTPGPTMSFQRAQQTATLLTNGQVLIAGGANLSGGLTTVTADAQLFDPTTNSFIPAGTMFTTRYAHTATLLADGRVLVAGGSSANAPLTAEIYTPAFLPAATNTPTPLPPQPTPTATLPPVTASPTPTLTPITLPTATPTATASGPGVTLVAVRVEPNGSPPDWQLANPPISRIAAGTRVQISVYAQFGASLSGQVAVTAKVMHNGQLYFQAGASEARSGAGDLWEHWSFTPKQTGAYQVTATLTALGQTQQLQAALTATRPNPSFTFDKLVTKNTQGHTATSFSRKERVLIVSTFTVNHAAHPITLAVGQQLEYPSGGGWKPLGKRVVNSFVTTNGTHSYTVSFYPQSPYSKIRMVIDATLGHQTRSRAVVFSVHS